MTFYWYFSLLIQIHRLYMRYWLSKEIISKEIKSCKKIVFIRFIHLHFTKIVFNSFEKKCICSAIC